MISLYKLNTRGAGPISFHNSEILVQHSVGIDTAFATMGYLLAHFSVVFIQPNVHASKQLKVVKSSENTPSLYLWLHSLQYSYIAFEGGIRKIVSIAICLDFSLS